MAGFKYKKFSFTGGDANFPSGITPTDIRTKEESIVKGFADALIAMNIGWQCDTDRDPNATTSSFTNVPKYSSSEFAPGLFLKNTTSGCKLFIAYVDDGNTENCGMALYDSDGTTKLMPADDYVVCRYDITPQLASKPLSLSGFIMSMIPVGSTNNFGSTFKASEFLPADATRLWSSAATISYNYMNGPALITRCYLNAVTVSVLATPYCVGYGCGIGTQYRGFVFSVGRIMGDLSNPTVDTTSQAKYGVLSLGVCISSGYPGNSYYMYYLGRAEYSATYNSYTINLRDVAESNTYLNNTLSILGKGYIDFSNYINYESVTTDSSYKGKCGLCGFSVCRADGTWVSRANNKFVAPHVDGVRLASAVYDATSNNRPWVPIGMYLFNLNPADDSIYNGDCFKGYLDTDLFRCSPQFAAGTVMDNGNFICTGEACLTLGWDPSNESW
jgi:hypothetical protein